VSLDLSADTKQFASDIAESHLFLLTKNLRARARSAQWPEDIINSLEVTSNVGKVYVSYPDDFKGQIDNLEYGNLNSLPQPVLRTFVSEAQAYLALALKTRVAEDIFENGGIW
jgi:hypothetical protein